MTETKSAPLLGNQGGNATSLSARKTDSVNPGWLMGFVLLHIPIGLAFRLVPLIATADALFVVALGIFFLVRDPRPARVIYVAAYITGMEVLWRSAGAAIFWETGKYAVIGLLLLALLKYGRGAKHSIWPFFYFLLLVPSVFILPSFDRQAIAFNLAGPFALAIAVIFFSMVRIDLGNFKVILISLLAPTIALATYVTSVIVTSQNIFFSNNSNFQTSGDYGPNQVSSILALGGVAAIYFALVEKKQLYRYIFLVLSLWLLAQSALTFSREGLWNAALAVLVTGFYVLRDARRRVGFIVASLIFYLVANFVIFPALDTFTGNSLSARFANLNSTGRLEIVQADLKVFQMFPLFGVGPGQSDPYHALTFRISSAHTEYSRMLAEHGIFGLLALLILAQAVLRCFISKVDPFSKGFLLGIMVWALLYMVSAATRLVAPSFLFGLAAAKFSLLEKDGPKLQ